MRANILSASAGSGKTYRLAYKYICDIIADPLSYRNILAVTFTNKATEEMKSRIIAEIHRLAADLKSAYLPALRSDLGLDDREIRRRAREAQSNILHDYSRFTVLTIDRFFQRILRAFIRELGIEIDYSVELDTDPVLGKSVDALIKNIGDDRELRQWLSDFCREQLDDDRSWDIRQVIMSIGSELFKESNRQPISNAKSKQELKNTVNNIVKSGQAAKESTKRLAQEALTVMRNAGVSHADFSGGNSQSCTRYFEKVLQDCACKPSATIIKRAETVDGWFTKKGGSPAAESIVGQLRQMLEELIRMQEQSRRLWNTEALIQKNYRRFALLSDLYDNAIRICDEEKMMLLSETKHLLAQFITDNEAPFIYEKVGARFDKFMIDEFQDTSTREWLNFLPLLRNAMAQSDDVSVLLVGDIKQSIYRWRGGDRKILQQQAAAALGTEDTRLESLCDNWRSLPAVVNFNNDIIARIVEADNALLNGALNEALQSGAITADTVQALHDALADTYADAAQTPRKQAEHCGFVDISVCVDEPPVVERIKSIIDKGFKPKDIMILVREKDKGSEIAETLLAFKHSNTDPRYAFDVMTQEALVIGSASVVKFVVAVLALALNPDDRIQCAVFRRFGGMQSPDVPLDEEEREFLRSICMLSPEEAFEQTVLHFGLDRRPQYTAYLQALHEQILNFSANKVADTRLFLDWWNETGCKKSLYVEQGESTIEITTIHKAKGLEKKVVIIPYCNWKLDPRAASGVINNYLWSAPRGNETVEALGTFPVSVSSAMADSYFADDYFAEKVASHIDNINLLYVALTRAVEQLHIFIADPGEKDTRTDTAGKLILSVLPAEDFAAGEDGCRHITFGENAAPCAEKREERSVRIAKIGEYTTHKAEMRLRLPSQRYFEDDDTAELSPRDFGILMHRAFENAESVEDIAASISRMADDGAISEAEAQHLRTRIEAELADPVVRSWFEKEPHGEVRNENDIVIPRSSSTRRPDRVIIRGRRATVVDYKFGHEKLHRHEKQVREYADLLKKMGFTEVEGYLWYVSLGEKVKV